MRYWLIGTLATAALCVASVAQAHHSFAVHFIGEKIISVSGVVTEFRFTNPHGLVFLDVTDTDGSKAQWRAETNSPNILRRRGWTPASIKAGDEVTIEGYPARDGSNSMRIYRVIYPDGRELTSQRPAEGVGDAD